jgi:hypothetical protein
LRNVIQYEEALDINFRQASICLDACFILAFLDSDDIRGDAVGNIMVKWQNDGINKIGIPYQVQSEVVHNLFKNSVIKALVSARKCQLNQLKGKGVRKYPLTLEENLLGQQKIANDLLRFAPKLPVIDIVNGKRAIIPISDILKEYKRTFPELRSSLSPFYKTAIDKMLQFVNTLTTDFGFKVDWLDLDQDIMDLAESYMTLFQLEIFDAMHLASSQYNYYNYFATLDRDFVHNLYESEGISLKIVNIA